MHEQKCNVCGDHAELMHSFSGETSKCDICGRYRERCSFSISLWIPWDTSALFRSQIEEFCDIYNVDINLNMSEIDEQSVASYVVADVSCAADIYCFDQQKLSLLVRAGALAAPTDRIAHELKQSNDAASVASASVDGKIYGYPMSTYNGFFMYYDKSLFTEEDVESMERIIEICNENGKDFCFALENAWYTTSFFFATGCESTWIIDDFGRFSDVHDTFNSDNGIIALRAMQKLTKAECYNSDDGDMSNIGVLVSGVWAMGQVMDALGENYAATDLPAFEIDGRTYHLGSYSGHNIMGVKPQASSDKADLLSLLARYLTGAECQLQRFEWDHEIPSNLLAQQAYAVQQDAAFAAHVKQAAYATPQGNIHGDWWNIMASVGYRIRNSAPDEQSLRNILADYENSVKAILSSSRSVPTAYMGRRKDFI